MTMPQLRKIKALILSSVLLAGSSPAIADIASGNYLGISYYRQSVEGKLEGENYPSDLNKFDSVHVRYGFFLASFLAVEFHGGTSFPSYASNSSSRTASNSYIGAAFGRLNLPFPHKQINLYLLGGVATGDYTADTGSTNVGVISETKTGTSAGIGVEVYSSKTTGMSFEYFRYIQATDFRSDGVAVGIVHHFSFPKFFY